MASDYGLSDSTVTFVLSIFLIKFSCFFMIILTF